MSSMYASCDRQGALGCASLDARFLAAALPDRPPPADHDGGCEKPCTSHCRACWSHPPLPTPHSPPPAPPPNPPTHTHACTHHLQGLEEMMGSGVLAGFPVVDVRTVLLDGAFHDVDSSVLAFTLAARAAFRCGAVPRMAGAGVLRGPGRVLGPGVPCLHPPPPRATGWGGEPCAPGFVAGRACAKLECSCWSPSCGWRWSRPRTTWATSSAT